MAIVSDREGFPISGALVNRWNMDVLRENTNDAVFVDVKRHLNLWYATWRRGNAELKRPETVAVTCRRVLPCKNFDAKRLLVVDGCGERGVESQHWPSLCCVLVYLFVF